jgi:hypothetical protein
MRRGIIAPFRSRGQCKRKNFVAQGRHFIFCNQKKICAYASAVKRTPIEAKEFSDFFSLSFFLRPIFTGRRDCA